MNPPARPALLLRAQGPSRHETLELITRHGPVVVADMPPPPVLPVGAEFLPVKNFEPAEIAAAWHARGWPPPRACFTFVDPLVVAAAGVAALLGVDGPADDEVRAVKDKWLFRRKLAAGGIEQPAFTALGFRGVVRFDFPCVIKPRTGAYGLGVAYLEDPSARERYWEEGAREPSEKKWTAYLGDTRGSGWLLEELAEGCELSIEMLGGHPPEVIAIHERVVARVESHFQENRFVTAPWRVPPARLPEITRQAVRICEVAGFFRGVGNLEACLTQDGRLLPIELQLCPTGGLVSAMVGETEGIDLNEWHALAHLGLPLPPRRAHRGACAMEVLHAPTPGRWRIDGIEECLRCPGIFAGRILDPQPIVRVPHADYLGFVTARAEAPSAAVHQLENALAHLKLNLLEA